MRFTHGWDPVQLLTWTMVAFGIIITMWQGWDCTQQYLAQPVRVEEKLVSVAELPPIQLSICKIFGIDDPADPIVVDQPANTFNLFADEYDEVIESPQDTSNLPTGTVPIFANNTADFWNKLDKRGESYQLDTFIKTIEFWNSSADNWYIIYGQGTGDASTLDMAFYPFERNSTLLCYTLQAGLAGMGTNFRIVTTTAADARKYSSCIQYLLSKMQKCPYGSGSGS